MTLRTDPWPAGVPCWADSSAHDIPAALDFYQGIFGWACDGPDAAYGDYALMTVRGANAAGVAPVPPGGAPAWTVYLSTTDADATAAAVAEHGGTVLMAPMDVGPLGRMAIVADPTGATFGLWQAGHHIGAAVTNEPGALTWEDLRSSDPDAARAFYAAVFGYEYEALEGAGDYQMFRNPGSDPLGGMGATTGDASPSHWLVYFGVTDTDATVAAATAGGGSVVTPAWDTPYGRMAELADPQGGRFAVVSMPPA